MGCICVEPALALRSADAGPSAACIGELVTRLSCRMADTRAQHTPVGPGTEEADVPGMRCCGSCSGPNGPARCDVVALVLVQADRVSPARSRTAVESTSGPIVAAVSASSLLLRWSGSGFGASRSGIASTQSDGSRVDFRPDRRCCERQLAAAVHQSSAARLPHALVS